MNTFYTHIQPNIIKFSDDSLIPENLQCHYAINYNVWGIDYFFENYILEESPDGIFLALENNDMFGLLLENSLNETSVIDIPRIYIVITEEFMNGTSKFQEFILNAAKNNEIYSTGIEGFRPGKDYFFFISLYDYLYGTYYVPAIASYYNYQEQLDSPIPREYSLTSEYHGEFRNNAKCLNEELAKLPGLSVLAFENSPYADSLLVDINGDVIEKPVLADGGYTIPNGETRQNVLAGEVSDLDGNLIRANKAGNYEILIPIEAANVNVMLDNTRTIDGVMYISDSRLGINEENSRTK